ncbi:MAG: NAD(P)-dependent oxidoreductase [Pseudomonadales bacterium]|nr:NAD(P)-dependent oxidoreductase [Pseudomonadales bacterium]
MTDKNGFIGLGNMGKPMAMNLARADRDLTVFDLNPDTFADLKDLGAKVASSIPDLGASCDIVEIVVMNDRQVEQVICGNESEKGLLSGMQSGSLIVIHSTVQPQTCIRMAAAAQEVGVNLIDAAVSGAEERSLDGTLTLLVGGEIAQLERVKPVFDIVGEQVFHMGEVGMGQAAKLCNNLMSLVNIQVVEEALALARVAGIDEEKMLEIARVSTGDSWAVRNIHPMRALISRASHGGLSTARMGGKDLVLAFKLGQSLGVDLDFTKFTLDRARPEK